MAETERIERSKPPEDEEIDMIVQIPNINEVDQESQITEKELLSTTTAIESERLKSNTSAEDEKKAVIADGIIEIRDPITPLEEDGADSSCSCCGCCK